MTIFSVSRLVEDLAVAQAVTVVLGDGRRAAGHFKVLQLALELESMGQCGGAWCRARAHRERGLFDLSGLGRGLGLT